MRDQNRDARSRDDELIVVASRVVSRCDPRLLAPLYSFRPDLA